MKNALNQIGVSAAALFLFGVLPVQAQERATADVPFAFHSNMASYQSGTYQVAAPFGGSSTLVLTNAETRNASFVPTANSLQATDRTLARGPVMIFKCEQSCYLDEVWTASKGYKISHPVTNEEASTTRIVALVRATR